MEDKEMSFIPTKSSLIKVGAPESFECVTFNSYKKKCKPGESTKQKYPRTQGTKEEPLDMKKVRYEVIKFGMKGFKPEQYQEAKVALAVELGAKPPKRPYINYKELLEKKKKEHEIKQTLPAEKNKVLKKKRPTLMQRKKDNVLELYGRPGQASANKKRRK